MKLAKQLKRYAKQNGDPKVDNPHTAKVLNELLA
jgi:hypothetical protein